MLCKSDNLLTEKDAGTFPSFFKDNFKFFPGKAIECQDMLHFYN